MVERCSVFLRGYKLQNFESLTFCLLFWGDLTLVSCDCSWVVPVVLCHVVLSVSSSLQFSQEFRQVRLISSVFLRMCLVGFG